MSEHKHTAGPWWIFEELKETDRYPGIEAEDFSIVIWGDETDDQGVQGPTQEEATANARLIAASPKLLLACEKALGLVKATWVKDHGSETVGTVWGALEEAIEKATKES